MSRLVELLEKLSPEFVVHPADLALIRKFGAQRNDAILGFPGPFLFAGFLLQKLFLGLFQQENAERNQEKDERNEPRRNQPDALLHGIGGESGRWLFMGNTEVRG
jgi:hypothetical protein